MDPSLARQVTSYEDIAPDAAPVPVAVWIPPVQPSVPKTEKTLVSLMSLVVDADKEVVTLSKATVGSRESQVNRSPRYRRRSRSRSIRRHRSRERVKRHRSRERSVISRNFNKR